MSCNQETECRRCPYFPICNMDGSATPPADLNMDQWLKDLEKEKADRPVGVGLFHTYYGEASPLDGIVRQLMGMPSEQPKKKKKRRRRRKNKKQKSEA